MARRQGILPGTPAPPQNDNLQNATVLVGMSGMVSVTNLDATIESGEPLHAGVPGGSSVWWSWTAPASGTAEFSTAMSDFDTILAVYVGTSVDALTFIAGNDDEGASSTSQVEFSLVGGTVYRIAVDGFGGAEGSILLSWTLAPEARTRARFWQEYE